MQRLHAGLASAGVAGGEVGVWGGGGGADQEGLCPDCLKAGATPHLFPQRYCSLALTAVHVCSNACSCV